MSALISTWLNLAIVHTHDRANHLWQDDHVAEVSLDALGLLAGSGVAVLLGGTQTLEEGVVLTLEAVLETTTGTGVHEVHELGHGHHEKVLEVHSTVGVLAEGLLLRGGVSHGSALRLPCTLRCPC